MSRSLEEVRRCFHARKQELMDKYKAQGGGIGKDEAGGYMIVLYLASSKGQPSEPVEVDGIPIQFKITGRMKLH